jgi:hypothetical protein
VAQPAQNRTRGSDTKGCSPALQIRQRFFANLTLNPDVIAVPHNRVRGCGGEVENSECLLLLLQLDRQGAQFGAWGVDRDIERPLLSDH